MKTFARSLVVLVALSRAAAAAGPEADKPAVVQGTLLEALFQMNSAESWVALNELALKLEAAYDRLPQSLGAPSAAAIDHWRQEKGCYRPYECWHHALRLHTAVVEGPNVRYSVKRFLEAREGDYPYCWVSVDFTVDAATRRLLLSQAGGELRPGELGLIYRECFTG